MAILNRRGNFVDFDPYKMLAGEFAYALDTEELYYCVSPGNVKRCATKEDIIEILETNQEAYDGLQQLLTELESETVLTGILNDISTLLDDVALNKSNIVSNTQDIVNLDDKVNTHLAENMSQIISTGIDLGAINDGGVTYVGPYSRQPKHISAMGRINNESLFWGEINGITQNHVRLNASQNPGGSSSSLIVLNNSTGGSVIGTGSIESDSRLKITWSKTGTITEQAIIYFTAFFHGGD